MTTLRSRGAGRFAPSPSGRMHLGNIFTALMAWLDASSRHERRILRIEDLDPQRSRPAYALQIADDLDWLGLTFEEGGTDNAGPCAPYHQTMRHEFYEEALANLNSKGLTYPCKCSRSDILATQAPHASDGRLLYPGTCRPLRLGGKHVDSVNDSDPKNKPCNIRLYLPEADIRFRDICFGQQKVNLAREFGDIVLRRADGAWAYQLAVVVDDALMGVTRVIRGCDLLSSSALQIYLHRLLGYAPPEFLHLPLICNEKGERLSKRDGSLNMDALRKRMRPEEIIGWLGYLGGLLPRIEPATPQELLPCYSPEKIPRLNTIRISALHEG